MILSLCFFVYFEVFWDDGFPMEQKGFVRATVSIEQLSNLTQRVRHWLPWPCLSWFWTKKKQILKVTGNVTLLLFYLWAKYKPIRLNFTGKTMIFSAYWFWAAIYYFQFTENKSFDSKNPSICAHISPTCREEVMGNTLFLVQSVLLFKIKK